MIHYILSKKSVEEYGAVTVDEIFKGYLSFDEIERMNTILSGYEIYKLRHFTKTVTVDYSPEKLNGMIEEGIVTEDEVQVLISAMGNVLDILKSSALKANKID